MEQINHNQGSWPCVACGKRNVKNAKFCGGCGKKPMIAAAMPDESVENLFASLSAQNWQLLEQFPKKLRKIINKKLKTNRAKKRFLAAGLAICLCAGATILLNASSPALKANYAKTRIDVTQVALNEKGAITFSDVALDHPVYKALQPLLELGLNCGDSQTRINPYEKMQWADWERINADLANLLGQEKKPAPSLGKGFVSNNDLKFYLANLRRKFCITRTEKTDNSTGENAPSRFEALSSLAMVVAELKNTN